MIINQAHPAFTISGTDEGDTATLLFGTPNVNTGAYITEIIAQGISSWSRYCLHFRLNHNRVDNTRRTQNAGLNNTRFTIRPDKASPTFT